MLALVLASSGLVVVIACGWRLRGGRATPAMSSILGVGLGLLLVGLFSEVVLFALATFLSPGLADNFWLFALFFLAGAAGLTVLQRRGPRTPPLPGIPI
jgi:hypothetical protein